MSRDEYLDLMDEYDDLYLEHKDLVDNGPESEDEEILYESILSTLNDLKDQMSEYSDNWF